MILRLRQRVVSWWLQDGKDNRLFGPPCPMCGRSMGSEEGWDLWYCELCDQELPREEGDEGFV